MYIVYCLLIWLGVYTFPSLAFFPKLLNSPKTAFAIPIVSVFVIYGLSSLLLYFHLFEMPWVIGFTLCFSLIALFRILKEKKSFIWKKEEGLIYLFHLIVLLPYFLKLGLNAFDRGDEIYSWNFWAIQHYFQETIDFFHTGAPYPQLFPKLLAFCYHLLGNLDLQLPVKATLIIFPWSMLVAIAMASPKKTPAYIGAYLLLLGYVLGIVGLEQFFNDGYADPVMTSALIVSIALLYTDLKLVPFVVIAAIVAAHSKQPALLWAMFSLPCLLLRQKCFAWAILSFLGGALWLLGDGGEFHHNQGVISLSFAGRDYLAQLIFAFKKYGLAEPFLSILFVAALICAFKQRTFRSLVLLFMIPSLLIWFFFGAYHLRLGQHLIALAFFIIVASGYALPKIIYQPGRALLHKANTWQPFILGSVVVGFLLFSIGVFQREYKAIDWSQGGRISLERYFDQDAQKIYDNIYTKPTLSLWVPSRYLYGLFYKHTKLTTPDYLSYPYYDKQALIEELKRKQPDYVFTVDKAVAHGKASLLLEEVIQQCPAAFQLVSSSTQKFAFTTYKVDKADLLQDACLQG